MRHDRPASHRFRGPRRLRRLLHVALSLVWLVASTGCGGCDDLLDPARYIDVGRPGFDTGPDGGAAGEDAGPGDASGGGGGEGDGDRKPSDAGFSFDFGSPDAQGQGFTLTTVVPAAGPLEGGTQVRVQGIGFRDGTRVWIGSREMAVVLSGGALVGRVPPGNGPGPVTVKAISPDGEARALVDAYTYVPGLRVTSISPTLVPTTGLVELEIRGSGFAEPAAVSFSGVAAPRVTVVDERLLRVLAPPRPRGLADVRITSPNDTVELDDAVRYYEPLSITAVKPGSGSPGGGETVRVEGQGFTSDVSFRFGSAPAQLLSVDAAAGEATVRTPPRPLGSVDGLVDVFVENAYDGAVLADAFLYRADDQPIVAAVHPAKGPTSGGDQAVVIGYGFDTPGATVTFGATPALVLVAEPTYAVVEVPPGAIGPADVDLRVGGAVEASLAQGYTYVEELWVDGVNPSQGPSAGGTAVTITGVGFTGARAVRFGGAPAGFTVVSDTRIDATAPAHPGGLVDVAVERGDQLATMRDAFTYHAPLEIWGFTPTRGSVAGGTWVEVRGSGFAGELHVTLAGVEGTGVRRRDRNNLVFYTPPNPPGEAALQVSAEGDTADAPYSFLYFDPAARFGGASGGQVDGAVNVTVYANGGGPIAGAYVLLSTRGDSPYQGFTDFNGQITLSGEEVHGPQTTTATAAGFSTTTVQTLDAENVTIFLNQLDPGSGTGSGVAPPRGAIYGDIRPEGKLSDPLDQSTYDLAIVGTTQTSVYAGNPSPGADSIVVGRGAYRITTRVGDLAVVGVCGTYHEPTQTFTPQLMAIERFLFVADGDELEVDLRCDIPLDQSVSYKLVNPIWAPEGPDINRVAVFWDLGFEGVFPSPTSGRGFGDVLSVENQPALTGELADISFAAIGGSYTGTGAPFSRSLRREIRSVATPVALPPLLDVPEPVSPQPGGVVVDRTIRFQADGPYLPDFFVLNLRNASGIAVWQFIVPGDETTAILPSFPDFSALPVDQRPEPLQPDLLFMSVIGLRMSAGHTYEGWSYRDIDVGQWEAYTVTSWALRLR